MTGSALYTLRHLTVPGVTAPRQSGGSGGFASSPEKRHLAFRLHFSQSSARGSGWTLRSQGCQCKVPLGDEPL